MKLITLQTKNTTYQMGVNDMGFLLHLYYGPRAQGDMSFLLAPADRGFSGNPYEARALKNFHFFLSGSFSFRLFSILCLEKSQKKPWFTP